MVYFFEKFYITSSDSMGKKNNLIRNACDIKMKLLNLDFSVPEIRTDNR